MTFLTLEENGYDDCTYGIQSLRNIVGNGYTGNTIAKGLEIAHGRDVSNNALNDTYRKIMLGVINTIEPKRNLDEILIGLSVPIAYSNYATILEQEARIVARRLGNESWFSVNQEWPDIREKWNVLSSHILKRYMGTTPEIPITETLDKKADYWGTANCTSQDALQDAVLRYARCTVPFDPIVIGLGLFDLTLPLHTVKEVQPLSRHSRANGAIKAFIGEAQRDDVLEVNPITLD